MDEFDLGDKVHFWADYWLFWYYCLANIKEGIIISKNDKVYVLKSGKKEYFIDKQRCYSSRRKAWDVIGL